MAEILVPHQYRERERERERQGKRQRQGKRGWREATEKGILSQQS
jgi:hypothetical protein